MSRLTKPRLHSIAMFLSVAHLASACGVEVHSNGGSSSTVYYPADSVSYTISRFDDHGGSYLQLHRDCIDLDDEPASDTVYVSDYVYGDEFAFTWLLKSDHLRLTMEEHGQLIHRSQYSYQFFSSANETEHKIVSSSGIEYLLTLSGPSCY